MKRRWNSTQFEKEWGYHCDDIAEMEGVSPEAIRMRVINYGTPWQRRKKLTKFEKKYGKTLGQMALELNLHPQTIARRERLHGDAYYQPDVGSGIRGKIMNERGEHWTENPLCPHFRIASTYMDQHDGKKKDT